MNHSNRFVAYFRVSTDKQGVRGLGIDAQKEAVQRYLRGVNGEQVGRGFEEVESGKRNDRPELKKALATCKTYNATLIIAKLDRLARNVAFISGLMESGVDFVAVDFPQANKLTIHILAAVAEHEAVMISARTKAALAVAKARGTVLGARDTERIGPYAHKGGTASGKVRLKNARQRALNLQPVVEEIRSRGVTTLNGIAEELNAKGITAPRGGRWRSTQVLHVLRHAPAPVALEVAA
jgi:DNA invertase Pin-like site-specific DNA recombinase